MSLALEILKEANPNYIKTPLSIRLSKRKHQKKRRERCRLERLCMACLVPLKPKDGTRCFKHRLEASKYAREWYRRKAREA